MEELRMTPERLPALRGIVDVETLYGELLPCAYCSHHTPVRFAVNRGGKWTGPAISACNGEHAIIATLTADHDTLLERVLVLEEENTKLRAVSREARDFICWTQIEPKATWYNYGAPLYATLRDLDEYDRARAALHSPVPSGGQS